MSPTDPLHPQSSPAPAAETREPARSRRRFLFAMSAGGVGAAALSSLPAQASGAQAPSAVPEQDGYRVTSHIRDYYKTTRL